MRVPYTFETFRRHPDWEPYVHEIKEPPWSTLDPGIVDLVALLWFAGFNPTDSGDGETKPVDERTIDGAHVVMVVRDAAAVYAEANRLQLLLSRLDICVEQIGSTVNIEASYDPAMGCAVLILCGVSGKAVAAEIDRRIPVPT